MPKKKHAAGNEEAEEIEIADVEESLEASLKTLRKKLKDCQTLCQEHLDGWQRANADLANVRREVRQERELHAKRAAENVITDLLPVLESFSMAMHGQGWQAVDANWRKGVEYIHSQLLDTLKAHGLSTFGSPNEPFDPARHESVATLPTESKDKDHTIAAVLQQGYALGEHLLRPAKVSVYTFTS